MVLTHLKNVLVKLDHFPRNRGENKKSLKAPPSKYITPRNGLTNGYLRLYITLLIGVITPYIIGRDPSCDNSSVLKWGFNYCSSLFEMPSSTSSQALQELSLTNLLMEEIPANQLECKKHLVSNWTNYLSIGVGFLPSTVSLAYVFIAPGWNHSTARFFIWILYPSKPRFDFKKLFPKRMVF